MLPEDPNEPEATETPAEETPEPEPKEGADPEVGEGEEASAKEKGDGEEATEKEADGEPDSETEKEKAKTEEKHKERRQGGWQRKIDRLEKQNQILIDQLAANRPATPASGATPGKEKTAEEKAEEYVDSLVERKLAARDTKDRQTKAQADFQRRYAEAQAAHADFDDVVQSVDVPVSQALQQALLTSEYGPRIMYELAKSPAELARISALPPLDAAREIGRLEAKQSSSTATPPKPKSATRPPVPPTSVGGSGSSTRNLDDLPLAEYKRAYRSGRR